MSPDNVSVEFDRRQLNETLRMFADAGANMLKAAVRIISDTSTVAFNRARAIAEGENIKRTGLYIKSMRMFPVETRGTEVSGGIFNAAKDAKSGFPYPLVIEKGSKPHIIEANKKKALRFIAKSGDEVIVKRVRHPGTKPRYVFKRAAEYAISKIYELAKGALERRWKK